ncbi:MAG: transcription elongation factor GreA [Patescibacteria group bacterium]
MKPQIPFTRAGYQKILDEKEKLIQERPEVVSNLQKAREMGDLSENGYYKESKARLGFLDGRRRRLEKLIKFGVVVKASQSETVEIGSQIKISDGKSEFSYQIVGGYESDPEKQTISHLSPIGKALMGKKKNDSVEVMMPAGTKTFKILQINESN